MVHEKKLDIDRGDLGSITMDENLMAKKYVYKE